MILALRRFEQELQRRIHEEGFADISVAHMNVLRHVDAAGIRLGDLARDAGMTKQGASQAVQSLIERDLVAVEPDPHDRRSKRVVYTARGREVIACGIAHVMAIEQEWSEQLGERRYRSLRKSLVELSV